MELITLRTLEAARRFPQEVPEGAATKERGREHVCAEHRVPLTPALVTTHGEAGDPALWRAYPLAVDAWICPAGGHLELALLTPAEVTDFLARGAKAAQAGYLDEAEVYFRRVTSSWPGYAAGRLNLGSVYLDRTRAEEARGGDWVERYRGVAADQFERAIACTPPPPHRTWLMLAQLYLRLMRPDRAKVVLADLARRDGLDQPTTNAMTGMMRDADDQLRHASARPSAPPPRPAVASVPPVALPPGPRLEHPYVELTLPHGWRQVEAAPGLLAAFEGPSNETVNVVAMEAPAPIEDLRATLAHVMDHHEKAVRGNSTRCDPEPAQVLEEGPVFVEARRVFVVQGGGPVWRLTARYAMTTGTAVMRDGREVHPIVEIAHYGQAWDGSSAAAAAVNAANLFPAVVQAARRTTEKAAQRFAPYFVTDAVVARRDAALQAAGRPAEGRRDLLEVGYDGGGLYLTVGEDHDSRVLTLFPSDLRDRGLDPDEVLAASTARVGALIGTEALPARVYPFGPFLAPPLWQPGVHAVVERLPTVKLLVVGPSWMAAGAANCKELFDLATRALGSSRLRLLVPHRDRCFVFAHQDDAASDALAAAILRVEAGATVPLSNALFWLWPSGLETLAAPPSLEDVFFSAKLGETREQIQARWQRPEDWRWDEAKCALIWRVPPTLAPLGLSYKVLGGGLHSIRVTALIEGDYAAFERFDELLRAWLPNLPLKSSDGTPWSAAAARSLLEGKGKPGMRVGHRVDCDLGARGSLGGLVFAGKRGEEQFYAIEIYFLPPGGTPNGAP